MGWNDQITSEPEILRGKPCIKGTRIPVALILGYLEARKPISAILADFPDLSEADVAAVLDYARSG